MDFIFGKKRNKALPDDGKEEKLMSIEEISQGDEELEQSKQMAQKSGFVSLRDRINFLAEQTRRHHGEHRRTKRQTSVPVEEREGVRRTAYQYATLQELFSSKFSSHKAHCTCSDCHQQKRPKIPIMKLTKEDWNVKCWEERLSSHKRRHQAAQSRQIATSEGSNFDGPNRPTKPVQQVEVFQGRIEEVATKLEKVREGLPLDEKLYELTLNKGRREAKSSHEWTDLLKQELEKGVHDRTVLKSNVAKIGCGKNGSSDTRTTYKSPLGRPIRSIFQDDDDDDDDGDGDDNENGDPATRPASSRN